MMSMTWRPLTYLRTFSIYFHELAVVIPLDVFVDVDDEGVDRIGFKFCMHC